MLVGKTGAAGGVVQQASLKPIGRPRQACVEALMGSSLA
jgi:hypothetical protein